MNILFIHEIDWLRKVVFEIHTLSERLSLAGHHVYALDYESLWVKENFFDFGHLQTKTVEKVARAYPDANVTLIRPGFIKIPGLSRVSAAFTHYRAIKRTIAEKKIDVIILYSVPTNGWQTVHFARKYGVPVVFRSIDILHQLVPYRILSAATGFMERRIYPKADLILTISPRLSRYVVGKGAAPDRVKLLLLGIDTQTFRPLPDDADIRSKWGFGQEDQIIEFIGTLYGFSGLDGLIDRFHRILEKVPQARLLIVGDGPQRPELEKIIAARGLNKHIVITGFQPYETMPQYINTAAVCVNPFLITDVTRDIFPTKIVQYMACGKPVLATPLPGMKELVSGEEQGILYVENTDALEEGIISLLKSADYRERLGKAALDYVKQQHDYDKIVQQLESILAELAAAKKK